MAGEIVKVIALALIVWLVSTTIASAKIAEPLRAWIEGPPAQRHWDRKPSTFRSWLHELITCQRCLSHWVALPACWFFEPRLLTSRAAIVAWIANWLLVVAINDVIARAFKKNVEPEVIADPARRRRLDIAS